MKTVWILNHYARMPNESGGTRHFSLALEMQKHGWRTVILCAKFDPADYDPPRTQQVRPRINVIDGVWFLRLHAPAYKGNGLGRMMNMLMFTLQVLRPKNLVGLPAPDVVIGSSVHPLAGVAAKILASRYSKPFVFEVRDLWPQTLVDMGRLSDGSYITRALRWIESELYRRAAKIVSVLPHACEYIAATGVARERVVWIPNGVDTEIFADVSRDYDGSWADTFTIMYFGAHGFANALEVVVDAMHIVRATDAERSIQLRLIGSGTLKSTLVDQARRLDLENVRFEPAVSKLDVPRLAREADAFVISVRDLPNLYRYGIGMNKLFEYMACGKPVVIASGIIDNPIAAAGCGYSIAPADPKGMAEAFLMLSSLSAEERLAMGAAGKSYALRYHDFKALGANLARELNDLVERTPQSSSLGAEG